MVRPHILAKMTQANRSLARSPCPALNGMKLELQMIVSGSNLRHQLLQIMVSLITMDET